MQSPAPALRLASHHPFFTAGVGRNARHERKPMTTTSPWQPGELSPEPDARIAAVEPLYRALLAKLHAAAYISEDDLPTAAAIMAAIDLAADLALASGLLWAQPDLAAALRTLADDLEQRREAEPPRPLLPTVRQLFASARPPSAH